MKGNSSWKHHGFLETSTAGKITFKTPPDLVGIYLWTVKTFSPPYKHIYRSENIVNKYTKWTFSNKKIHLIEQVFSWKNHHFLWDSRVPTRKSPDLPKVRGAPAPVRLDLGSSDATVDPSSDPSGKPSGRWQRQWGWAASFGRSEKVGKNEKHPVKIHQEVTSEAYI